MNGRTGVSGYTTMFKRDLFWRYGGKTQAVAKTRNKEPYSFWGVDPTTGTGHDAVWPVSRATASIMIELVGRAAADPLCTPRLWLSDQNEKAWLSMYNRFRPGLLPYYVHREDVSSISSCASVLDMLCKLGPVPDDFGLTIIDGNNHDPNIAPIDLLRLFLQLRPWHTLFMTLGGATPQRIQRQDAKYRTRYEDWFIGVGTYVQTMPRRRDLVLIRPTKRLWWYLIFAPSKWVTNGELHKLSTQSFTITKNQFDRDMHQWGFEGVQERLSANGFSQGLRERQAWEKATTLLQFVSYRSDPANFEQAMKEAVL